MSPSTPSLVLPTREEAAAAVRTAARRIAPVWPLDRFVAVNPYFGLADLRFEDAAALLQRADGLRTTMPLAWYLAAIDAGRIAPDVLAEELAAVGLPGDPAEELAPHRAAPAARSGRGGTTVARVATELLGRDWVHLEHERISTWAAVHFDRGQAAWRSGATQPSAYASWRDDARIDRTPEVMGAPGFRRAVAELPDDPADVAQRAAMVLHLDEDQLALFTHRLLLQLGGWAAHGAWLDFERSLRGEEGDAVVQFAAVLLGWELALFDSLERDGLDLAWAEARRDEAFASGLADVRQPLELVLQRALDRTAQAEVVASLQPSGAAGPPAAAVAPVAPTAPASRATSADRRASVQAIFCIDVRSEVLRRHLEAASDDIETFGFAGFFGAALEYVPVGHDRGRPQCPVLLSPTHTIAEVASAPGGQGEAVRHRRDRHHVQRAWKSFKMGAISCFSFVGPVGLLYLPKLFTDGSGRTRPNPRAEVEGLTSGQAHHLAPTLDPDGIAAGIDLDGQIGLAESVLRATSLHDDIADLVLVVGHGASTVNNPFESSLHCGACGGNTGEANARVVAAVLNRAEVRAGLAERGLAVPPGSWFVAALHDTTTDEVTLYDTDAVPAHLAAELAETRAHLAAASVATRAERAGRLGLAGDDDLAAAVHRRANDWSQVRPEWALAGCRAFIAAPRHRTKGRDLGGRAFLHSYDWRRDEGFGVLELILTAPVVVASWISLQYYASTVEPDAFGSGNKTLHNVVGRLGVVEGNGGDLRVGLPWQSVHDGTDLQHEPVKLTVVVEAPLDAIGDVLARNQHVADLCDNGWIHLLAMDDDGVVAHRYVGAGAWQPV